MQPSIPILIVIVLLIVVACTVLFASTRRSQWMGDETAADKYPYGFWMSVGTAVGIALGILLGLAVHTFVGGIAIGVGAGLMIGTYLDRRHKDGGRLRTAQEEQDRLRRATWGLLAVILFVLATLISAVLPLLR